MSGSVRELRVGVLVDQFAELSETFIAAEARELQRTGHAVHIEARQHAPNHNPAAAKGLSVSYGENDTRPRRLADLVWLLLRHPVRSASDLWLRRRWAGEEEVARLRALAPPARRLSRFGAVHVHAHFAAGAALDGLRLARLIGVPFSLATHGYDIFQWPRNLREKHERAAFAVTACEYSLRHLRGFVSPAAAERLHKVVVGVDGEQFRRQTTPVSSGTVLAVGRLVEKKGFRHLVEAAALLADAASFEQVLIVGDGPLRDELRELADSLGASSRVRFLGAQSPDEIRRLLEEVAVVAVPSVVASDGDRDTMPVIAKEALAMEVPVVASDEVGLPEVVGPPWGRLVGPGDPQELSQALLELLDRSPEERLRIGREGRRHVLATCSLQGGTRRLAELIARAGPGTEP